MKSLEEELASKNDSTSFRCTQCGRIIEPDESWRKCFMCGDPVCVEHTYFLRTRRQGLYDYYDDVVRVCKRCRI